MVGGISGPGVRAPVVIVVGVVRTCQREAENGAGTQTPAGHGRSSRSAIPTGQQRTPIAADGALFSNAAYGRSSRLRT